MNIRPNGQILTVTSAHFRFAYQKSVQLKQSGTPEGARRLQLEDNDPAYAVPIKSYIIGCLQRTQAVGLGPYWEKADEGARKSLEKFLS